MTSLLVLVLFSTLQTVVQANTIPLQTNIHQQGVTDFAYVQPFRSTSDGRFVSHDLSFADHHARAKRSFVNDESADHVTLDLNIDNHPLRLILDMSYDINLIMSPDIRVAEDNGDVIDEPFDSSCFHVGHVINYPESHLSISSCEGVLTGLISFNKTEYAIEPKLQFTTDSNSKSMGKRHIFYRRTFDNQRQLQSSEVEKLSRYRRRARSSPRRPRYYIETMLLLDNSVVRVVGKKFIQNYIVMMMARVNEAFQHPSLTFDITVYITDIIKLSKSKSKKFPSENKSELLATVCDYRRRMNPKPRTNPKHSDAIVYLTRKSFESFEGHSHIGRMCADSCTIVQDQGSNTASIVAHEIGHLLSMGHDDDENCGDNEFSVMSSTIRSTSFQWSSCSNKSLKKFLSTSQSSCLKDRPHLRTLRLTAPPTLPGRGLSRTDLCRQEFGSGYKMFKENSRNCEKLVCMRKDGSCRIFRKVLDGTSCGNNMECKQNKCVTVTQKSSTTVKRKS
ncbi:A disintegrin and metalloproteinase with thrombospondin motifs 2-like [Anneissia japonica]|uniref:A disintegrin and metalloproteinase with thrombospondin motifs 2-like n=1 Tax=Anneissia japonica TaxID=1529436 RepID=UPI0014254C44|nr:A disintegrin and metalloproteinase with thrombospondin motifs 2-like [Anneissia japonica]